MAVVDKVLPALEEYEKASKRFSVIWNDYVNREEDTKVRIYKHDQYSRI